MSAAAELGKRPLDVDPAEFRPDPHAGFARYRPRAGVIAFETGLPVVIRYADVVALASDPRTRLLEASGLEARGIRSGALHAFYTNSMLTSNAPDHARRRRSAARAFAHPLIAAWRPRIRALVGELIDEIAPAGEADFLATIASPLPSRLIAEILGAPREDAPRFAALVYAMSRGIGAFRDGEFAAIEAAATELTAYVAGLLQERRRAPRDDFLTDYLARVGEAGSFGEVETLIQIVTLILAGSDTTRFALTMAVALLLRHPGQWQALVADPALAPAAAAEALRFEPPVGALGRNVVEPLEVDGVRLPPGTPVVLSLLSAQRDERVFARAGVFDIGRSDQIRLSASFGGGPHRCLGEALARAELEEALAALAVRLPSLRMLGEPPQARGHTGIRGITPMRVGWAVSS